jgi:hypothetical protein
MNVENFFESYSNSNLLNLVLVTVSITYTHVELWCFSNRIRLYNCLGHTRRIASRDKRTRAVLFRLQRFSFNSARSVAAL